ncbi:(2Fe-2S)-binding protein [Streptomyces sp. NPDC053048]|uniref:(2Fe-2S)-binding protein n=1 Tax=Streptomyces sp. NPDC053048 TaxID=3365694 RepID=UPI0037D153D2
MSDEQQRHTHAPAEGGWQPIPRGGELDAEGTTFVQLPPELLAHPGTAASTAAQGWSPLAAPGTGYAPPAADAWQQPAAPVSVADGQWGVPAYEASYGHHVAGAAEGGADDGGAADPHATQQWPAPFAGDEGALSSPEPAATGQWSVPAAGDDSVDESGEYPLREAGMEARHEYAASLGGVTGAGDNPTAEWTAAAHVPPAPAPEPEPRPEPPLDHAPEEPEPVAVPETDAAADGVTADASAADASVADAAVVAEPGGEGGPVAAPADLHAEHHVDLPVDPPVDLPAEPEPPAQPHNEHPCASYVLRVNGTDRPVTDAWIGESLLYVLRERLGLAGAKDGCSQGECGACSVQVDGRLVASCLVPAATTAGSEIRTVEGLAEHGQPSDVQRALAECGAVQCGFCVPGLAMTVHDLLEGNHAPTELETRQAICGNLCRCSGYRGVLDAVRQVVDERAEAAAVLEEDRAQQEPDAATASIPHQAGPYGPYDGGSDSGSGRAMA